MQVGEKTIQTLKELFNELIDTHQKKIGEAFLKSDTGNVKMAVTFNIGISREKMDYFDVAATINFTTEKIKMRIEKSVSEIQERLPGIS